MNYLLGILMVGVGMLAILCCAEAITNPGDLL